MTISHHIYWIAFALSMAACGVFFSNMMFRNANKLAEALDRFSCVELQKIDDDWSTGMRLTSAVVVGKEYVMGLDQGAFPLRGIQRVECGLSAMEKHKFTAKFIGEDGERAMAAMGISADWWFDQRDALAARLKMANPAIDIAFMK